MTTAFRSVPAVAPELAHDWGLAAGLAAGRVPASGREAADWTVRGWAEIALGAVAADLPAALYGLDDAVRRSSVPCAGPYSGRLRALRSLGGELPAWYLGEPVRAERAQNAAFLLPEPTRQAMTVLARYCDMLDAELTRITGARGGSGDAVPVWSTTIDHLRWGERLRAAPLMIGYTVLDTNVPESLVRRSWMRLPSQSTPSAVLIRPNARSEATVRQRIRQGLHNGAHLDQLAALAGRDGSPAWQPSPIEFGAGLMTAEAYAMSVEIVASAQCAAAGRIAEARELYGGLVSRIGRVPGYKAWRGGAAAADSPALRRAVADQVEEFNALPTLASAYVAGPLRLIGNWWRDPLIPDHLAARIQGRWAQVCERFEPAAELAALIDSRLG